MEEEKSIYPVIVAGGCNQEVAKVKRDAPPAHYTFKIESFSQLLKFLDKTGSKKYESHDFEVAGYKWKLALYPDGDSERKGSNHISLYLVLSETNDLPIGCEVNVFFKLFVYDQIQDQYLTVQDTSKKPMRFHAMKTEYGFPKFLPLATFNDTSNGYLVKDCCIFGAEIFVTNCTGKGESVSIKNPQKTITLTLKNFSSLGKEVRKSNPVDIAGYSWHLLVYPNGDSASSEGYISAFLALKSDLSVEQKVWADFTLRIKNQVGGLHFENKSQHWFGTNWGYSDFLQLNDLKDKSKGYILNDNVIVEAEVVQLLSVKDF